MRKATLILFIILLSFIVSPLAYLAADLSSLALAKEEGKPLVVLPEKIEMYGKPGQKLLSQLTIKNRGNLPVRMKVLSRDYRIVDENGKIEFYEDQDHGMSRILVPEFLEVSLNPSEEKVVKFLTVIPQDVASGGHYGAILFEKANEKSYGPKNSFGTLVLLTVISESGRATMVGKVDSFNPASRIQGAGPTKFDLAMSNAGNTHFQTEGRLVISDWRGREVADLKLGKQIVYPQTNREFRWNWKNNPGLGLYRSEIILTSLGENPQTFSEKDWFVIFPWLGVLYVALGILAAVIVGLLLYRRRSSVYGRVKLIQNGFFLKPKIKS